MKSTNSVAVQTPPKAMQQKERPVNFAATVPESPASSAPKPMTTAQTILLTVKILGIFGLICLALWLLEKFAA